MHGRPRHRAGEQPFDKKELAQAAELQKLLPVFLHNNRARCFSKEALLQNERVIELNPEFNTAWNYRKRCVDYLLKQESEDDARKDIAQNELDLVVRALKVNPKSYGAWYHRKWVIRLGLSSLEAEFMLLKKLLKVDDRNFHGWNYRRFVVKTKGVTAEDELLFTTDKINENFSNYSAWHNRSALLSEISSHETSDSGSIQDRLEEEYELVKNSFFTDPDDQSAWFYYSWLLGQMVAPVGTHLNGSWPPANSRINIDRNGICSLPTAGTPIEKLEALPLLISFSKPVTGVHSQSVAVKVNGKGNLQLDWKPSVPSEKYCLRWTTQIMHQVLLEQLLENGNFTVDVLIGESLGIESPDAQEIDSPSQWSFYVHAEEDSSPAKLEEGTHAESQGDMTQGHHTQGVWQLEILDREIEMCRELLELENNSKWARLTLARLLLAHSSYNTSCCESYRREAQKHFKELAVLDPPHSEYYQHEQSLLLLQELTKNSSSLKRRYQDGILQFKDCSLSSIAYTERFLWVQHLDLSKNHLRSVHGLDALQLLVCLNLSDNHIGSVAALAPLRELPELQDVDVSQNEIGMHPVDSCRFLFPSQLIHSCKGASTPLKGGTCWQIGAAFQGLRWRKFVVVGNPVAQDKESLSALRGALPYTEVLS